MKGKKDNRVTKANVSQVLSTESCLFVNQTFGRSRGYQLSKG